MSIRRTFGRTGIGDEGSVEAGLSIRDRLGHERILVAQTTWGVVIDISHEGDTIALLQCVDDLPGADPGVGLEFCAAKGERVLRWFVDLDGDVTEEGPLLRLLKPTAPDK